MPNFAVTEGSELPKGASTQKLYTNKEMLIKSDLNANKSKGAIEDDYHLLKRTVWQNSSTKPGTDSKVRQSETLS